MLDVESDAGGGLEQSAIFAGSARTCLDEFSVGFRLRHALRLRRLGLNPNRNGYGAGGPTRRFTFGEVRQPPGIGDHQFLRFGDELLQCRFLFGCDGSFAVFFEQLVEPSLLGGRKLSQSRGNSFLHRSVPSEHGRTPETAACPLYLGLGRLPIPRGGDLGGVLGGHGDRCALFGFDRLIGPAVAISDQSPRTVSTALTSSCAPKNKMCASSNFARSHSGPYT